MSDTATLASMASIPERELAMLRAVAALAPQVDQLAVSLNGYPSIPGKLARWPNVLPTLRPDPNGGDAEKFAAVDEWPGYVLTCDDDLLYPPDYVAHTLEGIERLGRKRAVSYHGGTTLGWNGSAVAASHKRVRCLGELPEDDLDVNVLGTGVMGYHAARVPVWRSLFRHANMADVQYACHARRMGVPSACLAHAAGWLTDICPREGRRIYEAQRGRGGYPELNTTEQRAAEIRKFDWLQPPPGRPRVRVSIATCKRPQLLLELLRDLEREAGWVDIELAVYEDPLGLSDYTEARTLCQRRGWKWHRFSQHLGRERFWRLVHRQLTHARGSSAEWYLFLPDDVRLVRHAIPRAIDTWHLLEDPATLTLWRLQSLEGKANWTGRRPVQNGHATETFHVDGLYLCQRPALDALGWRCTDPRFPYESGSGVGRQLSKRLHGAGKRMYRVDSSLVWCTDGGVSVMNPHERQRHPSVAL